MSMLIRIVYLELLQLKVHFGCALVVTQYWSLHECLLMSFKHLHLYFVISCVLALQTLHGFWLPCAIQSQYRPFWAFYFPPILALQNTVLALMDITLTAQSTLNVLGKQELSHILLLQFRDETNKTVYYSMHVKAHIPWLESQAFLVGTDLTMVLSGHSLFKAHIWFFS